MFEFKVLHKNQKSQARCGQFTTPHGNLMTPEYTFVATEGEIKAIPKEILKTLPVNLIIVNTFHLYVKGIVPNSSVISNEMRDLTKRNMLLDFPARKCYALCVAGGSPDKLVRNDKHNKTNKFDIHAYSGFNGTIMSDSGGFQVFSLGFGKTHKIGKKLSVIARECNDRSNPSKVRPSHNGIAAVASLLRNDNDSNNPLTITEEGVTFTYDEREIALTPEKSMAIQRQIGADIMFAFDECTSPLNSKKYTEESMERTHRWLKRCIKYHSNTPGETVRSPRGCPVNICHSRENVAIVPQAGMTEKREQALFGIVQGGEYEDLRKKSAKFVGKQDVQGFGIGGSLGGWDVLDWSIPYLPEEKLRHFLGIGRVGDVFEGVERGVDTFDCVIPTREARHKVIYTFKGKMNLRKMKNIDEPLDKDCKCLACCERITFKKLHELFVIANERKNGTGGRAGRAPDSVERSEPWRDGQALTESGTRNIAFMYATIHNIQFFSDLMQKIRESIEKNAFFELKTEILKYY